jgi:SAM-dependent methyltransferase
VTAKPLSAEYFDQWYANQVATTTVAEITNRHMGLPGDLRAGVVPATAIGDFVAALRLAPGAVLLDLACGRGGYGLLVARETGATLRGVDFSAQALAEAREQAAALGVAGGEFTVGTLEATGLPDGLADAVLCTDAIQFPDDPAAAYREIRRVLRPGGRVALTCWEVTDRADEDLSPRLRAVDLQAGLAGAGFTDIEVTERPDWRARERSMWEEAVALDPGDDPALRSLHDEGLRSLQRFALLRRMFATATAPGN